MITLNSTLRCLFWLDFYHEKPEIVLFYLSYPAIYYQKWKNMNDKLTGYWRLFPITVVFRIQIQKLILASCLKHSIVLLNKQMEDQKKEKWIEELCIFL